MMRRILAGLFLLLFSSAALAQATAWVESIGLNNHYRPDCWTPMLVHVKADRSGAYQIHVIQDDLDRDRVIFWREITVTGTDEGAGEQLFWMYFIPQPTNHGLLDVSRGGTTNELQKQIRVFVCDSNGKQISQAKITNPITNLEPQAQQWGVTRGAKFILAVVDPESRLLWRDYFESVGMLEQVIMVPIPAEKLPESALGLDAVDAILWLNPNPPDPSLPSEERRMQAIQQYVRSGGELVICQPPQRDVTAAWGDLLPVTVKEIAERDNLSPLRELANPRNDQVFKKSWDGARGPFQMAKARAKPGAIVSEWIEWSDKPDDRTPYIVRSVVGLGSVTWVAQNLADPNITTQAKVGWPHVWDRVFDWNNDTLVVDNKTPRELKRPYEGGQAMDLGPSFIQINLPGKSRAFIGLAVVFFVIYWLVAGPGIYLYLVARARAYMSWFLFGASAIAATLVTVLLVQLVVRGDPELQHVTVIRKAYKEPAVILSRFGLYIPRDNYQRFTLANAQAGSGSYISAFAIHPELLDKENEFPAYMEYRIPVQEAEAGEPVMVDFFYRSTLKKIQARWTGPMEMDIQGSVRLLEDSRINGKLFNATGLKLRNIYFAYHDSGRAQDWVLYLPEWNKSATIDLSEQYKKVKFVAAPGDPVGTGAMPEDGAVVQGRLGSELEWPRYWYSPLRGGGFAATTWDDSSRPIKRSFPMLSLFDRLPPTKGDNRIELLRRGVRQLDLSHAVAAGALVILAESEGPLPMPLEVEGDPVKGEGTIFYQFLLPLERPNEPPQEISDQVEKKT